ncbi:MAG: hypothetical protein NTY51_07785 [Deltaproteobacteria bacterium]|nr:hypothetical protein [Deltaproteobacteria bacterium]
MLAKKVDEFASGNLISYHFVDTEHQVEFDALTNNEDRIDYIELIRGIEQVKEHGTISLDELKALLSAE